MNKLICLISIIVFTSCSEGRLTKLSVNCLCSVSEHFVASTDEEVNNTKEFSFTNSRIFNFGVSKESFALSSAVLIKNDFEIDSTSLIKISLVSDNGIGQKQTKSYTFEQKELEKLSPKYYEIETLINEFVKNIYENEFSKCLYLTEIDIDVEEFNSIMNEINLGLEEGYVDTRIIGYTVGELEYSIYGGIWTKNKILNLFTMDLKETANGLRIIGFRF